MELEGDLKRHVGWMLLLDHTSDVVTMIVEEAFSIVVREVGDGSLSFKDAQVRLDEETRAGILRKMEDDHRRAVAHGGENPTPPTLGRNGNLPPSARFRLECMPAYDRLKFMESLAARQPIGNPG